MEAQDQLNAAHERYRSLLALLTPPDDAGAVIISFAAKGREGDQVGTIYGVPIFRQQDAD